MNSLEGGGLNCTGKGRTELSSARVTAVVGEEFGREVGNGIRRGISGIGVSGVSKARSDAGRVSFGWN